MRVSETGPTSGIGIVLGGLLERFLAFGWGLGPIWAHHRPLWLSRPALLTLFCGGGIPEPYPDRSRPDHVPIPLGH